jgi:SAM-dependent methyltransferase
VDRLRWNRLRYSAYAPFYDLVVGRLGLLRRGRKRAFALAALQPGERLLLIAAGTGLDLPFVPAGVAITAVDIAPAMLRRLDARARALGRNVETFAMDAVRLRFADGSFDAVALHLALAVVPDPVATIREAARVLRPAGRVSIFDKFLPDDATPSIARRGANVLAGLAATELNRRIGPLLAAAGLEERAREQVGWRGFFVVVRADKSRSASLEEEDAVLARARGDRAAGSRREEIERFARAEPQGLRQRRDQPIGMSSGHVLDDDDRARRIVAERDPDEVQRMDLRLP